MVEKDPSYRVTFKSMASVSYLGNMAPFVKTDVTNPREIYSMLSDSRQQGAVLSVNPQTGAKLPPLQTSSTLQFRSLAEQSPSMHSSYPDLLSFRSQPDTQANRVSVWRSSSLQDVSSLDHTDSVTTSKNLKPILRASDAKSTSEHHEKGSVKFGQREVHLIKDPPLPPIEGLPPGGKSKLSINSGVKAKGEEDFYLGHSPRNHRRSGPECSPDIFPRGQPVEVKKPMTPTYDDYPEVYWKLRSTTVHDPSDLKDDMIDRDRYRLQQISSLRLRAMNREVAANRLDSYRKWQQQIQDSSPQLVSPAKQDSARGSATSVSNGPVVSARAGKQQRMSMPIRNHSLAVAAKSISPVVNPSAKKRVNNNKYPESDRTAQSNGYITADEFHRQQNLEAAARGGNGAQEGKPLKATVVNLCIEPDRSSITPTSDIYTGIRRIMFGARPLSDKARTFVSSQSQDQRQGQVSIHGAPGSVSGVSVNATLGSSHSHRHARVPSAPTDFPSHTDADTTDRDTDTSPANKKIMRKFNRLQVFSENNPASENSQEEHRGAMHTRSSVRSPYLPHSRAPTYKLDMRHYPSRRHDSAGRTTVGDEMGMINEGGGYPLLVSEMAGVPILAHQSDKSEATALSFRFSNGEVIISRKGKKPDVT